jgi:hypothetical protein
MQVIAEPDLLVDSLSRELDRASRYGHELTLVVLLEGAELEPLAAQYCRASDLKGACGDDLAVALLEADRHVGARYLRRLRSQLGVEFAAGCAHYPSDAATADELLNRASKSARS